MTPTTARTTTIPVPGAELHVETCGSGPLLLLICGGVYDAGGYAELAAQLAGRWTVVTYDRRGNSRSPLAGPPAPQEIAVHADDARRVLTAAGASPAAPACVFGNSSGGTIAVELAGRHPELVRAVVAHEPPLFDLLDDRDRWRRMLAEIDAALAAGDVGAALGVLGAGMQEGREAGAEANAEPADASADADPAPGPDDVPRADAGGDDGAAAEMAARIAGNMAQFIRWEVPSFSRHVPDLDALRAGGVRVLGAAGEASAGEPPHRAGLALAAALGGEPLLLPGDHGGFGGATVDAFAQRLEAAFAAA